MKHLAERGPKDYTDIPGEERISSRKREFPMQIKLASVVVDDQEKALGFYTSVLGFVKKADIPMGPFRWLTVSSPEGA